VLIGDLADRHTLLFGDQPLVEAVVAMEESEKRQLVVVEREAP
jgi:CBS domain-containing protein